MLEFAIFLYGLLAGFVLLVSKRNEREARSNPAVVQAIGWGLLSLSSVLAVLLFAMALALAVGAGSPLIATL